MDEGVQGTTTGPSLPLASPVSDPAPAAPARTAPSDAGRPHRVHLARDLTVIAVLLAVLLAATGAGGAALLRTVYGPAAFVEHYLSELAAGHAADALRVPGVAVGRSVLASEGLPKSASQALLRQAALAPLSDVRIVRQHRSGDSADITASYRAGGHAGTTTFAVRRVGNGILPTWRFARSPLAVVDLTVHGSMSFQVNGFSIDKRQVTPAGAAVNPADPVPLLVFSPGLYSVRVDTAISHAAGVAVLSDVPAKNVPVTVRTTPTTKFVAVVQQRVDDFLTRCTTQQVLQPTGCPFGFIVRNRIQAPPRWSMVSQPTVAVVPNGEGWAIPVTKGVAHIVVDIQSIYDGSLHHISQDVPFAMTGAIEIDPDGTASIRVSAVGGSN